MEDFTTTEVSDALISLGVKHGGFIPDIRQYSPRDRIRISGPAYTVKMVHFDEKEAPKPEKHFVDAAPAGHIIVIEVPRNVRSAVWGGLMTLGAKHREALGVVISGRFRDLAEHEEAGFPVFAVGQSTLGQKSFTRPSELNVPIHIGADDGGWPDVEVLPGSWIIADEDGVVCVPESLMEQLKENCRTRRVVDENCRIDILAGKSVEETFKRWR